MIRVQGLRSIRSVRVIVCDRMERRLALRLFLVVHSTILHLNCDSCSKVERERIENSKSEG